MDIRYTKQAKKQIETLNEPIKSRIEKGIVRLPAGDIKKLQGYSNLFRLRIGDYRVIFEPQGTDILVYMVITGGSVYREI